MKVHVPTRLVLGPQRPNVNLRTAVDALEPRPGSLAVISAGWQEAENDIGDIREVVGVPLTDLELYGRAMRLFAAVPDFEKAYRARQDRLQEQQRLYRLRLKQLAYAARQTLRAEGDAEMIAAEQRHAIAQLRALDRHHLQRTEIIHGAFEETWHAGSVPGLEVHRQEIAAILDANDAVLITGGNIIVLLNRMRLFGLGDLLRNRHIVAWSAGAMVLASRIVLFHDALPQGRRDAEVLGAGLGMLRRHVLLPDAASRIREHDRLRVGFMSRRFAPDICVALDSGSLVDFKGDKLATATAARRLQVNGRLGRLRAA